MLIAIMVILKGKKKEISKFASFFHSLMSPHPLIALEQFRQENNGRLQFLTK